MHGRELQRPRRARSFPHPPSPCAGTTASRSTTTTRSSSASAAPGACSRSSSGIARWACRSRCAPLPRPAFGPTSVGWPRRAGTCTRRRARTSACVCATTPWLPPLQRSDVVPSDLCRFALGSGQSRSRPSGSTLSSRTTPTASSELASSQGDFLFGPRRRCMYVRHAPHFRSSETAWFSSVALSTRAGVPPSHCSRATGGDSQEARMARVKRLVRVHPIRERTRSPGAPSNAVFRIWRHFRLILDCVCGRRTVGAVWVNVCHR